MMNIGSFSRSNPATTRRKQAGLTLVEILVTVVVISIGLLGIAALHLTSLRNSFDSNNRSKATWFAHDIVDRMRANRTAARTGAYNIAMGATATGGTVAALDVIAWKTQMASSGSGLLSGDGSIETTPVGNSIVFKITIQWQERTGAGLTSFETQTEI